MVAAASARIEHRLVVAREDGLADALLQDLETHVLVPQLHHAGAAEVGRHGDGDRLDVDRIGTPGLGQIHLKALLHHGGRHHEDDEQHQHDVDERHDVDLGKRRPDAGAAAPPPPRPSDLMHCWQSVPRKSVAGPRRAGPPPPRPYVKLRSEMFRNSSEKSSISLLKCFTRVVNWL